MLFIIATVITFNLITIFITKRISGIEILTTTLFALLLQVIVDVFLDLKYELYGYFNKGVDLSTMLYIFGIYPAVNIVFLNYFPYRQSIREKAKYILIWTVFAVIFEMLFLWSGTFYYNSWNLWYSAPIYPVLYLTLMMFHKYTCYLLERYRMSSP